MDYLVPFKLLVSSVVVFGCAALAVILAANIWPKQKEAPAIIVLPLVAVLLLDPIVILVSAIWLIWTL